MTQVIEDILTLVSFALMVSLQCPVKEALTTINRIMEPTKTPTEPTPQVQTSSFKSFDSIPGPKGLPIIGTLFDYMKKDGLRFNKLFEVNCSIRDCLINENTNRSNIKEIQRKIYISNVYTFDIL